MLKLNQDFSDMIQCLNEAQVEYVVIGAYAMAHFGYIRTTGDMDFFVKADANNSKKILAALRKFGAPLFSIKEDYFAIEGNFFQIGAPPLRIDLLTKMDGLSFSDTIKTALEVGQNPSFKILSLDNLIKNKEATHRDRDKSDAAELRRLRDQGQAQAG